jgi:hypothetical protein
MFSESLQLSFSYPWTRLLFPKQRAGLCPRIYLRGNVFGNSFARNGLHDTIFMTKQGALLSLEFHLRVHLPENWSLQSVAEWLSYCKHDKSCHQ